MNVTRRDFLRYFGMATGGLGLATLGACSMDAAPAPAATESERPQRAFSFAYVTLGWAGIEVIHKQELLAKRGWNIAWQSVGPISGVVNAFASGQVDLCDMSAMLAAQLHENGVKFRIVGAAVATLGAIVSPRAPRSRRSPTCAVARWEVSPARRRCRTSTPHSARSTASICSPRRSSSRPLPHPTLPACCSRGTEAGIVWEPITSLLTMDGRFRVLATQQELWERASGLTGSQVHVVYITTPAVADEYASLIADLNAAQAEVAGLWRRQAPAAVDAIAEVTEMPEAVVTAALGRTTPLHGLTDEHIAILLAQLKQNREYGTLLTSDLWLDPGKVREALFPAR